MSEIYREKVVVEAGLALSERLPVARELGETGLAHGPSHDRRSDQRMAVDDIGGILEQATG